jgi:acetylornithine/succinyldiaminopimelate/putrescine aminotransferase
MKHIGQDTKENIISRFRKHVSSGKADFFEMFNMDFIFGRREGPYVWDAVTSKRLINCHSNGGVFNLGHRNPEIIQALKESMEELDIGNHHLISEHRALLAQKMADLTPGDISYTVFGSGGGEAIDLAIKLARGYTQKLKIISAGGGYHGHTGLALSTGDPKYRDPFGQTPPGFAQVPFDDMDALEAEIDDNTAAVIFETIPATYGMPIPQQDFYPFTLSLCHRYGALLIMDEIQTGLGRTGKFWGIDNFSVVPDILVTGKGLSGGIFPISATCFRPEFESFFNKNPFIHISTFGGAEVGCPVALKTLEISSTPSFLNHVQRIAKIFTDGFKTLKNKHPEILVGLRQLGLMMGIEMVNDQCGPVLSKTLFDNGILSVYANNNTKVSQLLPPLTIDTSLAEEILERLDKGLDAAKNFLNL